MILRANVRIFGVVIAWRLDVIAYCSTISEDSDDF